PIVSVDTGFLPTHFGARDAAISTKGAVMGSGTGTWGVGVQIAKVSFVKDLTHKIKLAYYQGTNSSRAVKDGWYDDLITTRNCNDMYLTDKDHAWEVNFDHEYKIYENLTAMLELGYINLDLNRSTWRDYGTDGDRNNSAWKAQVLFRYSF
ncbi:MAG: porin, partial [Desulfovibrio sp.]|nr:porin [Desulfovibrio sp.]